MYLVNRIIGIMRAKNSKHKLTFDKVIHGRL